jgi:hypothetical protein
LVTSSDVQVRLQDLAAYSAYRIRLAASGIVLVVAAFLTTPGAAGGSIHSAEQAPGTWAACLLAVTLLLSLVAAVEARWAWALAAAVGCIATFAAILLLRSVVLGDNGDQAGPAFYAAGTGEPPPVQHFYAVVGGLAGAAWLMVFVAIWALIVLRAAWSKRGLPETLSV